MIVSNVPLTVCANAWMITPALALGRSTAAATALAAACDWPCNTSSSISIWYHYMYTEQKDMRLVCVSHKESAACSPCIHCTSVLAAKHTQGKASTSYICHNSTYQYSSIGQRRSNACGIIAGRGLSNGSASSLCVTRDEVCHNGDGCLILLQLPSVCCVCRTCNPHTQRH